jgi:hypothetical protein
MIIVLLLAQSALAGVRGESELKNVKIPKPEVAIIMNKQHLTPTYDLDLKQSFLPKVVASAQSKPF